MVENGAEWVINGLLGLLAAAYGFLFKNTYGRLMYVERELATTQIDIAKSLPTKEETRADFDKIMSTLERIPGLIEHQLGQHIKRQEKFNDEMRNKIEALAREKADK